MVNDMLMGIEDNALIRNTQLEEYVGDEEIQHVSISEGPYALSRKMKNIERIFTAGILRDWQDRVVEEIMLPNLVGLPG